MAIALTVVAAMVALALLGASQFWVIAALTLIAGLLGFSDDLLDLSPAVRFPVQIAVVCIAVWWAGTLPPVALPMGVNLEGWSLTIVVVIAGLWWINLFNFMDGIDGIAASHAILVLLGMAAVWALKGPAAGDEPIFWLAILTSAATLGFLLRNWAPARIFMGDAGSNSLAISIFVIALASVAAGQLSYQALLILPSAFISDATVTLLVRSARGERPWRAHRLHAYQHLSRVWGHHRTTLVYCAWTAFWGFPLALAAEFWPALAWPLVVLGYLPMIGFALWAGAGRREEVVAVD